MNDRSYYALVIRSMILEDPEIFCPQLVDMMAQCVITLIFLPHMKGSFLYGASFIDGKKIVMGLTERGRDADRFWFSLFHEIAHIIKGHIGKLMEQQMTMRMRLMHLQRRSLFLERIFHLLFRTNYSRKMPYANLRIE